MALGTTQAARADSIFVDMKTNARNGKDQVGFRQETGFKIVKDEKGVDTRQKIFAFHDFVSGKLIGFTPKEEPTYEDHNIKEFIGYLTLADKGQPNVAVRFRIGNYHGRRMVGLINGALASDTQDLFIRMTFSAEGDKIGDWVLDNNMAFLTVRKGDANGEKIEPLYMDESGAPLVDKEGKPLPLPKPKEHEISRKKILDYTEADDIALNTVVAITQVLEAERAERKQSREQGATNAHANDDFDPREAAAAAAAAPRG